MNYYIVILHELFHGLGLTHDDADKESTVPDIMIALGAKKEKFPNLPDKYFEKNENGVKVLKDNVTRVVTLNNLITVLEKAGVMINEDRTGIKVDFKNEGGGLEHILRIGDPKNHYFDKLGHHDGGW